MLLCILGLLTFSCSKDADLLSEYVISDKNDLQSIALLVDDTYFISNGQPSILLDVLNNDRFDQNAQVNIVATSTPKHGDVMINEDNTLTYTPQNESGSEVANEPLQEDSFTYTTEAITEDNSTFREEATVTITSSDMGELKAFPGAEGFGKYTSGGRGGAIVEVTNLNDDGPGSLRFALESIKGKRIVIFNVSGSIILKSPLTIDAGYGDVTIAGETAPGDGITIEGSSFWISDSNVIIRYLRIRPGYDWNLVSNGQNDDVLRIISWNELIENIIIDHCSLSWGKDENIEIGANGGQGVRNVTIQNSIISENIGAGYGFIVWQRANNISIYKNLFAHNSGRNVESTSPDSSFEMINNIIYNYISGTRLAYQNKMNLIGNSYITKPGVDISFENVRLEKGTSDTGIEKTEAYIKDNISNGGPISISNSGITDLMPYLKDNEVLSSITENILSSDLLESHLLESVGASKKRDEVDIRIISELKSRTGGFIQNENEVGGYPFIKQEIRPNSYDTDKDGMQDSWEIERFGNLNQTHDGDENGDGYTNIEEFLYELTIR
jgi:hypothetical protein